MQINIDDPSLPYGVDLEEIGVEEDIDDYKFYDTSDVAEIYKDTSNDLKSLNESMLINFKL